MVIADSDHRGITADGRLVAGDPGKTTYVAIAAPSAGTWTLEPHAGSAAITRVRQADGLPEPEVSGSVASVEITPACLCTSGDHRLSWKLTAIDGQTITFVEEGPDGSQVIGSTSAASGSLTFTPRPGSEGERRVSAVVD